MATPIEVLRNNDVYTLSKVIVIPELSSATFSVTIPELSPNTVYTLRRLFVTVKNGIAKMDLYQIPDSDIISLGAPEPLRQLNRLHPDNTSMLAYFGTDFIRQDAYRFASIHVGDGFIRSNNNAKGPVLGEISLNTADAPDIFVAGEHFCVELSEEDDYEPLEICFNATFEET